MRTLITDKQWKTIEPLLPKQRGRPGRPYKGSHRMTLEAILWIARTGAPWRDLPSEFGKWNTVYRRFRRWSEDGVFAEVLAALEGELDFDVMMVDGTFVKVHQHGTGALKEEALPTSPEPHKPLGEAEEGSPPRSPRSPTLTADSPGSH